MPAPKRNLARILTLSLGGLWLLDGILQLQPAMFTGAFVEQVLAPTLTSQPHWMVAVINFGINVWNLNPVLFNLAAAVVQLFIGFMILLPALKRQRDNKNNEHIAQRRLDLQRFALWLSVFWALLIWIFGEGLGILFTGSATFYAGAPGSALLYAILALFLLYDANERRDATATAAASDKSTERPLKKLPVVAGIIFLAGAALQLTPMFWQPTMLSMLAMVPSVSGWLGQFGAQGTMLGNFLAIDALAALGIFLILMPRNRTVAWLACAFLVAVWWIGQNFGGIFTFPFGTATDPNSALVMMLFLVPIILNP